jgi:hypothetical protein
MDPRRDAGVKGAMKMNCKVLALCALLFPFEARAQEECSSTEKMEGNQLLRRLSLDLKNRVPTGAEITAQTGISDVRATKIDEYLEDPAFLQVIRRYHNSLLWPNLDQIEIIPETNMLYPYPAGPNPEDVIYLSYLRAVFVRAAPNGTNLYLPCKNEPAQFDGQGNLIVEPVMEGNVIVAYQEGYVMVEPYWAPGTQIKVCGLDALPAARAVACPGPEERYPFLEPSCQQIQIFADYVQAPFRGSEVDCNSSLSIFAPGCGCGENLRYCARPEERQIIRESLLEQMGRIIDRAVSANRPYHEVLTDPLVEYNGPVVHYLRNQISLSFDIFAEPDATAPVPDMPFTDANWIASTRTGRHSGVLTTPGYLLRFSTNRGRAHRFYNAFECSSFIPNGPLPSPFEPCSQHEDLTQRCGCDACHQALEPMASHWGRFAEYGFAHLDETNYPTRATQCVPPLSSVTELFQCYRLYELDPIGEEIPYQGLLNSYVFRTEQERAFIDEGPRHLADDSVSSGRFASCTARKMWTYFMRREPTADEEANVLPSMQQRFVDGGYNLKTLIKEIVSQPAYGRLQ